MKKILILVCILISEISFSQNTRLDSFINELRNHQQEDTVRLNFLNKIAYQYSDTNPEEGILAAGEAIALAQKLNKPEMLAGAYRNMGAAYDSKENDSMALHFYNLALHIYEQTDKKLETGKLLHNAGIVYQRSDAHKALEFHQRALKIFMELNEQDRIATVYKTIGVDYNYLSNYPKALESLQQALKIFEASGNKMQKGSVYSNMGITYTYLDNLPKSLEYHKNAIKIFREINYEKGLADELGNIGNVYDNMDDSSMALQSYKKALELSKKLKNKKGIGSNLLNIAIVYNYYDDYIKSFPYLTQALNLYEQLKMKEGISLCLSELSKIYRDAPVELLTLFGVNPKDRFTKTIEYQKRALVLYTETGYMMKESYCWGELAETYEKQKDFRNAYHAFQKSVALRDSVVNQKKSNQITRMEMQYVFSKKEDSIRSENEKKQLVAAAAIKQGQTKQNFIFAGAVLFLIAALVVFGFYKRRRDAEEKKHEAEFRTQVSDTELKALRAQMNPHFIFNSLNSVICYIANNEPKLATEYLNKFATVMRMTLENSEKKSIPLSDELKALELYMQLESKRLIDKFNYSIKVADDIDKENTLVPPMILQPFVENSIWHGIANKEGKGNIRIDINKNGQMLHCIIDDDGIGRNNIQHAEKSKDHVSLGMKITKSRIDIINKTKSSDGNVELFDMAKGMRVRLNLPYELSF